MSYKPIDGKNEDFRRYLDRKGVIDALTKSMVKCFQERPENAIEYLLENMGQSMQQKDTIEKLQAELSKAREEIKLLQSELDELKAAKVVVVEKSPVASPKAVAEPVVEEPKESPVPSPKSVTEAEPTVASPEAAPAKDEEVAEPVVPVKEATPEKEAAAPVVEPVAAAVEEPAPKSPIAAE